MGGVYRYFEDKTQKIIILENAAKIIEQQPY